MVITNLGLAWSRLFFLSFLPSLFSVEIFKKSKQKDVITLVIILSVLSSRKGAEEEKGHFLASKREACFYYQFSLHKWGLILWAWTLSEGSDSEGEVVTE